MTDINSQYRTYFERAKALCAMLLEAQDDLKQLKTDAREELVTEGLPGADAKAIKADLSEVFALAMIEAKGEQERAKQAAKLERRQRMAEVVGVQLGFDGIAPSTPVRRMARAAVSGHTERLAHKLHDKIAAGEVSIGLPGEGGGMTEFKADGRGGVAVENVPPHDPETGEVRDPAPTPTPAAPADNADLDGGLDWAERMRAKVAAE